MSYTKQFWNDFPSGGTPISAARLNHMEEGIASAGSTAAADAASTIANTALSLANTAVTKANNAQAALDALGGTVEPTTGGFNTSSGWTLNRGNVIKIGRLIACDISVTRNGSTITVNSSGNIANTQLGSVNSAFRNWGQYQGITAGPGGSVNSIYIQGTNIYLAAWAPGSNITSGTEVTFAGVWIAAS